MFAQQPRDERFSFMPSNILFAAESVRWIAKCIFRKSMSKAGLMHSFQFTMQIRGFWTCNCKIPSQSSCMPSMCNGGTYMARANSMIENSSA